MAGLPPLTIPEQTCCLGLEKDIWAYVGHLVATFREVRRVLRGDGTLWLNLGDSYASPGKGGPWDEARTRGKNGRVSYAQQTNRGELPDLKPKDLIGTPWRVALALQADGWYLRSDVIWHKPNPMPESVTDRPTKAHEYVFLLSKGERYYYDAEAVKEGAQDWGARNRTNNKSHSGKTGLQPHTGLENQDYSESGRNRRTVWTVATAPFHGSHFAVFPDRLIEPMTLASTSEHGVCGECGAPWVRVVEKSGGSWENRKAQGEPTRRGQSSSKGTAWNFEVGSSLVTTTGWLPSCQCAAPVVPAVILDPFAGSGTTLQVAIKHRRRGLGIDANPTYAQELASERLNGTQIVMGGL